MSRERVFITGGLGFIGSHVVAKLRATRPDVQITVYDNCASYLETPGQRDGWTRRLRHERVARVATIIPNDIRDRRALLEAVRQTGPTHVLHLAGVPLANVAREQPDLVADINVNGLVSLLQAMRQNLDCLRRLVFVSSSFVYGHFLRETASESDSPKPIDMYGASKLAGELLTRAYCAAVGVDFVILRPSAAYGPFDTNGRIVQACVEAALDHRPIRLHANSSPLDFTYVGDIADAMVQALFEPRASGEVFNITRGEARTLDELAVAVSTVLPGLVVEYASAPFDRPRRGALDISKARKILGYAPHFRLEAGVATYVAALQQLEQDERHEIAAAG